MTDLNRELASGKRLARRLAIMCAAVAVLYGAVVCIQRAGTFFAFEGYGPQAATQALLVLFASPAIEVVQLLVCAVCFACVSRGRGLMSGQASKTLLIGGVLVLATAIAGIPLSGAISRALFQSAYDAPLFMLDAISPISLLAAGLMLVFSRVSHQGAAVLREVEGLV